MWPLLLCSLLSMTVILERAFFWLRVNIADDRNAIESLLETCRAHDPNDGGEQTANEAAGHGAVYAMLLSGVAYHGFSASKAMEAVALEELKKMRRGMNILDTVITAAPMLGILGTVTGIIGSFTALGQAGPGDPRTAIAGIAEALITTAAGLIISIGTVFPFNYYNARIEDARDLFEHYGTRLETARPRDTRQTARSGAL
jgi:biopolymer transport protein ExbB